MSDYRWRESDEVRCARAAGSPIVALESSVITQGLPWPHNLAAAADTEAAVRSAGAVPATIAILDGEIVVGLNPADFERLARGVEIRKASPRDIPYLMARGQSGATTVAGTIFVAYRAGIRVMATGGIGGVHRGFVDSGDISADLIELARTPVAVVCSGAKAILDLPRTLEFLETHSVLVVGFQTDEFPAFFARSSGLPLDSRADTPAQVAEIIRLGDQLRCASGLVVANPPPVQVAFTKQELDDVTAAAIAAAESAQVRGKAVTPFLLEHIRTLACPRAIAVNRAILEQNARLAAAIACAFASAGGRTPVQPGSAG